MKLPLATVGHRFSCEQVAGSNSPWLPCPRARPQLRDAQRCTTFAVSSHPCKLPDKEMQDNRAIVPEETPWFEAYRSAFLAIVPPSDHEFFNHPVASVSIVSAVRSNPPHCPLLSPALPPTHVRLIFGLPMPPPLGSSHTPRGSNDGLWATTLPALLLAFACE